MPLFIARNGFHLKRNKNYFDYLGSTATKLHRKLSTKVAKPVHHSMGGSIVINIKHFIKKKKNFWKKKVNYGRRLPTLSSCRKLSKTKQTNKKSKRKKREHVEFRC